MVRAAIERQSAASAGIRFEIGDLEGSAIAELAADRVIIDRDAAGFGWFVDSTPMDDSEFDGGKTNTAGRMDLMTVVLHELGHERGLTDSFAGDATGSVMFAYLNPGERRTSVSPKHHEHETRSR